MVNTFLPYADFIRSLARLDNKRIQKQSIEAFQIWMILTQPEIKTGFKNHPAVRMWKNYTNALRYYILLAVAETSRRITKTGKNYKIKKMAQNIQNYNLSMTSVEIQNIVYPWWFGNEKFHGAQRSMLYRKGKLASSNNFYDEFYSDSLIYGGYVWPKSTELEGFVENTKESNLRLASEKCDLVVFDTLRREGAKITKEHMNNFLMSGNAYAIEYALTLAYQDVKYDKILPEVIYSNMPIAYKEYLSKHGWTNKV